MDGSLNRETIATEVFGAIALAVERADIDTVVKLVNYLDEKLRGLKAFEPLNNALHSVTKSEFKKEAFSVTFNDLWPILGSYLIFSS